MEILEYALAGGALLFFALTILRIYQIGKLPFGRRNKGRAAVEIGLLMFAAGVCLDLGVALTSDPTDPSRWANVLFVMLVILILSVSAGVGIYWQLTVVERFHRHISQSPLYEELKTKSRIIRFFSRFLPKP